MKDLTQQYVEQLENMVKDLREKKLDLEEENKKLKEELEWYKEHYREKVDEEVLKGFGYNKKEIV